MQKVNKTNIVHFIGIGGIGMSSLAKFYLSEKAVVSGSDLESSEITEELKKMGAKIYTGAHNASNVPKNADLVIYNAAVDDKNPELIAARKIAKNINPVRGKTSAMSAVLKARASNGVKRYSEAVGELTEKYYTIAVAGAHGKSTTTAMAAKILIDAGLDPTVIIGTKIKEFEGPVPGAIEGSNFRKGNSKYFICSSARTHRRLAAMMMNGSYEQITQLSDHVKSGSHDDKLVYLLKSSLQETSAEGWVNNRDYRKRCVETATLAVRLFIIEADEYAASFLDYHPDIAIVTNIDKEHLDFYKNEDKIRGAFKKFMLNAKPEGFLVLNNDDKNILKLGLALAKLKRFRNKIKWYSLRNKNVDKIKNILQIPGSHNISNALAASKVGEILNIPDNSALKSLSEYGGAWRRFEYRGSINGAKIFDDYAHHPTEIKATLSGTRSRFPDSRIWCVFQPHQRRRLTALFDEFVLSFDAANEVIILEPYEVSGRETEKNEKEFSSFALAQKIDSRMKNNVYYIAYESELVDFLKKYASWGDVVIMMGAGDIWKLTKELI